MSVTESPDRDPFLVGPVPVAPSVGPAPGRPAGRTGMTSSTDDPADADRWLFVHEDQIIGAQSTVAVDLIREAGLVAHVAHFRGVAPSPSVPDTGRIRLVIGDDGRVRAARPG